ncbi:MAG: response regulator [Gammaproteobacteria bacterium]|nr:response regulator [Gammaproteobacteria bacterium]
MFKIEIKVNSLIVEILEDQSFNDFTISELKDEYINLSIDRPPVEARKFVYRQVLRLVKRGLLSKEDDKKFKRITYRKTELFSRVVLIKKNQINEQYYNLFSDVIKNDSTSAKTSLEAKLHEYKVNMLSVKAESEEYIQLAKLFPDMKEQLKEKYNLARDQSSKFLGQIKAINTLIYLQRGSK